MLNSTTFPIVFGAAFLAAYGAFAFEGRYVAGDKAYRGELTITKRADGRFDVTAVVGTERPYSDNFAPSRRVVLALIRRRIERLSGRETSLFFAEQGTSIP